MPRPRARSIGLTLIVLGGLLVPCVAFDPPTAHCASTSWSGTSVAGLLTGLVVLAGLVLVLARPRASAVAPGLALGAGLPLLGSAIGGISWVATTECSSSLLGASAALLIVQAGAALAVLVTSGWLLYVRDELEPWTGTRGVVLASAGGLAVLTLGIGAIAVWGSGSEIASVVSGTLAGPLPWAVAVALTGWLRRSPGVAVLVGGTMQVAALLLGVAT